MGNRRGDLKHIINGTTIIDATNDINDYADTATIDKVTEPYNFSRCFCRTYLAGAMGKPMWVLLPFAPDYRWLLDRDDSPWYPTVKQYK